MLKRKRLSLLEMDFRGAGRAASLDPQDPALSVAARNIARRGGQTLLYKAMEGYEKGVETFMSESGKAYAALKGVTTERSSYSDDDLPMVIRILKSALDAKLESYGSPLSKAAKKAIGVEFDKMRKSYSYMPDFLLSEIVALRGEYCGSGEEDEDCEGLFDNVIRALGYILERFFVALRGDAIQAGLLRGVMPLWSGLFPWAGDPGSLTTTLQQTSAMTGHLETLFKQEGFDSKKFYSKGLPVVRDTKRTNYKSGGDVRKHVRELFGDRFEKDALIAGRAYLLSLVE